MSRYEATITHYSIARARCVDVGDDLTVAKRLASKEFKGEFVDYVIVIRDKTRKYYDTDIVASRRVGDRKWQNWNDDEY